jgi:agmatinase
MAGRVEEVVGELLEGGKFVVTLGGEHTVAVGALRAHARRWPDLSVLAVDAHSDLREEYLDTPYNHACTLRRILEALPPGDGEPLVQVGLRSASAQEAALIRERRLPFHSPRSLRQAGPDALVAPLRASVYVTIDLDGLDPSQMAAVGAPEPGGLLWDEVSDLLAALAAQRRIVGFDVTELAPHLGPEACAQAAAKLTYRLIGLALGPQG